MKAGGKKAWRQIYVKIIIGRFVQPWRYRANPHCGYTETEIEGTLENVIEWLDRKYPTLDFKQVQIGPNKFNFIATEVRNNARTERASSGFSKSGALERSRQSIEGETDIPGVNPDAGNQDSATISAHKPDAVDCQQGLCEQGPQNH